MATVLLSSAAYLCIELPACAVESRQQKRPRSGQTRENRLEFSRQRARNLLNASPYMPEEDIETAELKESVEASVEHALEAEREAEREKTGWTVYLSLSTAIIAVFAAVASLESGANSNDAILEKNDAVLHQSKASDEWALYQAKVIRATVLQGESEFATVSNPDLASRLRDESTRLKSEQAALSDKARGLEEQVETHNARAERLLDRHHRFAIAVTLFQIAVALCAIAALMKKKPLWIVALAASAIGGVLFALGFLAPV